MRFNSASHVSELVWQMRLADLPRDENRTIIERLFNGDAPFSETDAEDNNIQVNRNDLKGVNYLTQARRQWYQAFLKPGDYFSIRYDSGNALKRDSWAKSVTRNANRVLRRNRSYKEQERGTGANVVLHGIGPTTWKNRLSPIPEVLPISSVMVPSETLVGMENCSYIALFQEWTPAQLWSLTHGPKVDPGWNMDLVKAQWEYVKNQVVKQPNATAFQYMPSRIESLIKQDVGFWASDAVPTIDVWTFLFREEEDGGWYRRIVLDWEVAPGQTFTKNSPMPKDDSHGQFLYSSGKRVYAKSLSELLHFQFGDCSATAPFRYHSVRSLGWMLWGLADLENRLHCKFSESLFEQCMWFFRVASNNDLIRIKKADFHHMGVIPQGIDWVKSQERFSPDQNLMRMGFDRFSSLMAENAAAFTQDFDRGASGKEMTATETMARVNAVNALVSGMLTLAYDYEEDKDREIMRRLCIKNSPDPMAQKFRQLCFQDEVPPEMLDVDRMDISRERVMGGGNKTLEMAEVQFLQSIRKNVGPDAQRRIDHISIESATDNAELAEELAPLAGQQRISNSEHDAELATDRLMRGLDYSERPDMVYEDYAKVWLHDLATMVNANVQDGGMAKPEDIAGYNNMAQEIEKMLGYMESSQDEVPKVKEYRKALSDLMNHVKAFQQRLIQQMRSAQKNGGQSGIDPKTIGKIQADTILAQNKAKLGDQRSAQRMAMDQARFEQQQRQSEREHNAELRREATLTGLDIAKDVAKTRAKLFNE